MNSALVERPYPNPAYAWYVVGVLLLAYIFSFVDREVLALLVEPIKREFGLSDTEIAWLMGPAFAVFYTFFGIPIAWLADRSNRRLIIFSGVFLWSWMTALCGLAGSYLQLFLARVGVGVGEAALSPPALSMLRDYFPKDRIGRAVGVYTMGISVGSGVAYILSAALLPVLIAAGAMRLPLVGTVQPWQMLFVIVGLPGILVALLVLTIREPARRHNLAQAGARVSFWVTLEFVLQRWRCYIVFFLAFATLGIMAYGIGWWIPAFFERTYDLHGAALGSILVKRGIILMICGTIGVVGGGYLCDVLAKRYADGHLRVALGAFVLLLLGYTLFPLMPTPELAVMCFIPATLGAAAPTAAGAAALVTIAPPHMRAQIAAMFYFSISLIGGVLGPPAVALVTDHYFGSEADLRFSLALVAGGASLIGIALLLYCRRHFRTAVEAANAWA